MKRYIVLVTLLALAFALIGSTTWAFAQSSGEIGACVNKQGKVTALGGTDTLVCNPDKEVMIAWNIVGPQGEPGPMGPQGEPGPMGPQGVPGISGHEIVLVSEVNEDLGQGFNVLGVARCPAGKVAISGGYELLTVNDPAFNPTVSVSTVLPDGKGWHVLAVNHGTLSARIELRVYAICAYAN